MRKVRQGNDGRGQSAAVCTYSARGKKKKKRLVIYQLLRLAPSIKLCFFLHHFPSLFYLTFLFSAILPRSSQSQLPSETTVNRPRHPSLHTGVVSGPSRSSFPFPHSYGILISDLRPVLPCPATSKPTRRPCCVATQSVVCRCDAMPRAPAPLTESTKRNQSNLELPR